MPCLDDWKIIEVRETMAHCFIQHSICALQVVLGTGASEMWFHQYWQSSMQRPRSGHEWYGFTFQPWVLLTGLSLIWNDIFNFSMLISLSLSVSGLNWYWFYNVRIMLENARATRHGRSSRHIVKHLEHFQLLFFKIYLYLYTVWCTHPSHKIFLD